MNELTQHEQCVGFCYQSVYCNRYTVTVKHICRLTLTTQLLLRLFPPLEEDSFCILPVTCSPRRLPKFGPCGASTFCIHSFHEPLHFIQIGLNSSRFVFFRLAFIILPPIFNAIYNGLAIIWGSVRLFFSLRFIVAFRFHCFECVPYWLYAQVNETKINQNEVHTWSTFGQICVCLCVDVFDDHSYELWDVRLGLCLLVLLIARNHFETLQWPDTQNYPIVERNPTKFKLGEEVKSYNHKMPK